MQTRMKHTILKGVKPEISPIMITVRIPIYGLTPARDSGCCSCVETEKPIEQAMQTQVKPMIWFLTLLTLLSTPHLASAYYDPGVQRWINRDPRGEVGFEVTRGKVALPSANFINSYSFVRNEPTVLIDSFGLETSSSQLQSCLQSAKDVRTACDRGVDCAAAKLGQRLAQLKVGCDDWCLSRPGPPAIKAVCLAGCAALYTAGQAGKVAGQATGYAGCALVYEGAVRACVDQAADRPLPIID
jgi:RHS repeat-associated protein